MIINGVTTRIRIGALEVRRCPGLTIHSERHCPLSTATILLPDARGMLTRTIDAGDAVEIQLGYRDSEPVSWQGTVSATDAGRTRDQVRVRCCGAELPLATTSVTQSWRDETPEAVVAWCVRQAGLVPGRIDSPGVTLTHFAASEAPVWQAARQAAFSCQRAFGLDMNRWALWRGADGRVHWGDFDEPGPEPTIATGAGLIRHAPGGGPADWSLVETFLLPDMRHSRRFTLRDERRGLNGSHRALGVVHEVTPDAARTYLHFGVEHARFV